ncbi:MAG: peptide ABC transporter substrate-binding protein [Chlamydiales bacterium]|nr:peptide ABC transporter substrate-binding protein [Chlamydiales bacterium]
MCNIRLVLMLCLGTLAVSCHKQEDTKAMRHQQQSLSLNIFTEPPTMDPGLVQDVTSAHVMKMVFEGLTRHSEQGVMLAIAESIDISEDGRTYTFVLRKSLWSNGDPLTSHDFEYAWKRQLFPAFPAGLGELLYVIKGAKDAKNGLISLDEIGIHSIDDHTLVVQLENPTPYFTQMLELPPFYPLHRASVESNAVWSADTSDEYISNGPFILAHWSHHDQIVLPRNPNYWDTKSVKLNKITLQMIEDSNTELALFQEGDIDWAGLPFSRSLAPDSIVPLLAAGEVRVTEMAATAFYIFNISKPPFDNVKMRRAFSYAINRDEIVKNITCAGELPATSVTPPSILHAHVEYFADANLSEARRLFQEALQELGITKEQLPPITLNYNTNQLHNKVAQAVQQQWYNAFGIKIQLEHQEWKVFLDRVNSKDFSLAGLSFMSIYNDPLSLLELFNSRDSNMNASGWDDPIYADLIERANHTVDSTERLKILAEAEQRLIEEMPVAPVYFPNSASLRDPALKGYFIDPIGWGDVKTAYFE